MALLGSEHYWECITRIIQRLSNSLTAVEIAFGWAKHESKQLNFDVRSSYLQVLISAVDKQVPSILRRSWELEIVAVVEEADEDQSDNDIVQPSEASINKTNGTHKGGLPWKTDVYLDCTETRRESASKVLEGS